VKSHISHVVLDTQRWGGSVAYYLEQSPLVASYARNDHHLGFTIDYEFNGSQHTYTPDFLVRLQTQVTLILEVKGYENEQTHAKHEAAKRWCEAVSAWMEMGKWTFAVCKDPHTLNDRLQNLVSELPSN
jgi:type III restriction enzyme